MCSECEVGLKSEEIGAMWGVVLGREFRVAKSTLSRNVIQRNQERGSGQKNRRLQILVEGTCVGAH